MMSSVDGRTISKQWGKVKGTGQYEITGKKHKADAWMCGRVTMERDFAGTWPLTLEKATVPVERTDFVAKYQARTFAIAIDAGGKLNWTKAAIDKDHIISVLTEAVTDEYLLHLRQKGISYIFGGKKVIDFKVVMNKLAGLFPIKTLLLEGGGHLNGSILNAGLIDELSFLYLAVADGTPGTPTYFEVDPTAKKAQAGKLKLISVKKLPDDVLWVRYKVR